MTAKAQAGLEGATGKLSVRLRCSLQDDVHRRADRIGAGHESGRHIVDILKRNPKKDADKYTDEDLQHMRKVVSYCKVSTLASLSDSHRH